jgi:hypothetical protein
MENVWFSRNIRMMKQWIPAFAGMAVLMKKWISAFAGMTQKQKQK